MNQTIDTLLPHFKKLTEYRDQDGKSYTQQQMAEVLNKEGVLSLTGQPWSKYSVRRMLRKYEASAASGRKGAPKGTGRAVAQLSDDQIRQRIKKGLYDTESERYVAVPVVAEAQEKPKAPMVEKAGKKSGNKDKVKGGKGKGKKGKKKNKKGKK